MRLLEYRFSFSEEAERIQKRLQGQLRAESKAVICRIALARSLAENIRIDINSIEKYDSKGQSIQGITIFAGIDLITEAMVKQYYQKPMNQEELLKYIRIHMEIGLRLLNQDFDKHKSNAVDFLLSLINTYNKSKYSNILSNSTANELEKIESILEKKIIGQHEAKRFIKRYLMQAFSTPDKSLKQMFIFEGPASVGKTLFAKVITEILALPLIELQGSSISNLNEFIDKIESLPQIYEYIEIVQREGQSELLIYPPHIIFIDEAHLLKKPIQEALLTATEPQQRSILLGDRVLSTEKVTFILATTDIGKLVEAFRTRALIIPLKDYTENEIIEIIKLDSNMRKIDDRVLLLLAKAGRMVPRDIKKKIENLTLIIQQEKKLNFDSFNIENMINIMKNEWRMNEDGLTEDDIRYLKKLSEFDRPIGLNNMVDYLRISQTTIEEFIEPYLLRLQYIERLPNGRIISPNGKNYLKLNK